MEIIPGVQKFPDSIKLEPRPGVDQVPLAATKPEAMRDREIASLPDAKVTSMLNPEAPAWNQPPISTNIPDSNPEGPTWNQPPIASNIKERANESSLSNTSSTPSERAFHKMMELYQQSEYTATAAKQDCRNASKSAKEE